VGLPYFSAAGGRSYRGRWAASTGRSTNREGSRMGIEIGRLVVERAKKDGAER
jgi:hypothetical protein